MANVKLIFQGTEESKTSSQELQCYVNYQDDIYISITDTTSGHDFNFQSICLDKSTAIKFAKILRTEINKIQE